MESIPIEENKNWWWYKAKANLLIYFINSLKINNNLEILEVGPGKGNNLDTLKKFGNIDILENDLSFIQFIKENSPNIVGNYFKNFEEITKKYDLIVMLDVIEHIEDTEVFFRKLDKCLKNTGKIIISVPAYMTLWSEHDVKLKHFRRYNWKLLFEELQSYKIIKRSGFNFILLPIRFLQIKFSKNITTLNENSKLLNSFLYFLSFFEHLLRKLKINPKFGISLFVMVEK